MLQNIVKMWKFDFMPAKKKLKMCERFQRYFSVKWSSCYRIVFKEHFVIWDIICVFLVYLKKSDSSRQCVFYYLLHTFKFKIKRFITLRRYSSVAKLYCIKIRICRIEKRKTTICQNVERRRRRVFYYIRFLSCLLILIEYCRQIV